MNAETGERTADPTGSQPGTNATYVEFLARAKALKQDDVAGADELVAAVAMSDLPASTFRPLAKAIRAATGLDDEALVRQMRKARAALNQEKDKQTESEPPRSREELERTAARILVSPDVLTVLRNDLPALGVVGTGTPVLVP